ncbi:MAG: exodeoxyribonuclease III [Burkholderiales bacterium]|nr:exodeoxyribonuclease III [Burkholderiales bacterium]OJX08614.1 MAG: exodeoxyribonuclease III [Burkholderiales bacterium 70-64]
MKLATWNINSLNVRLQRVLDWLDAHPVDVLCLQETKLRDERFPRAAFEAIGYESAFAGQPTYNGVAILARRDSVGAPASVVVGNPLFPDEQQRLISATLAGLRIVCAYFPNGQSVDSDKYVYKLRWIDALIEWLSQPSPLPTVLLGDFNIAPEDRDVHDPVAWEGQVLCSPRERERFARLVALGYADAFRLFEQPAGLYSWWDYRQLAFPRNAGLRIDHIMVAEALAPRVRECRIDREARKGKQPSDHAPVIADIEPGGASG